MFYADEYRPDFGVPYPRYIHDPAKLNEMFPTDGELGEFYKTKAEIDLAAKGDPIAFGYRLESWEDVMGNFPHYRNHVILGGNRCLAGWQDIYDPILKQHRRVDSIKGAFHVYAWDGARVVIAEASQPFTKGLGEMVRVTLSNGQSFSAATTHQVFCADGLWRSVGELRVGYRLFQTPSTSDAYPEGHGPDAPRWSETQSGSPGDCRPESRLCDEQPRGAQDTDQAPSPSRDDAPTRTPVSDSIRRWLWRLCDRSHERMWDGRGNTPCGSRVSLKSLRLSIRGGLDLIAARFFGTLYRASCRPCKSALGSLAGRGLRLALGRWMLGSFPRQSTGGFSQQDSQCRLSWLTVDKLQPEGTAVKWDVTVAAHHNYLLAGAVHHNSSKSSFAASLVIDAAMNIPEAKIRCWHVNEERSIMEQQAMIWNALPERYKNMPKRRGTNHSISYSQRNGFTGGKLILPPVAGASKGSEILFANYQQYRNDPQVAEGWWAHLIWGDEEMPQQLFDTLQYRLIDARGRMVLTFTTLNGWTPLVSDIMARVKTLRRRKSMLLNREIPDAQESLTRPSTRIYYFWTQDNPFVPADDFLLSLKGRPDEEILARAHGIPSKSSSSPFPCFDETVHVIPASSTPWKVVRRDAKGNIIPPPPVTRYMVIDPSGSKPWFIIWAAVDARGAVYVYREFPDEGLGQWAVPGKDAFGMPGPAQKALGWGFEDYRDMMLRCESENGEPEEIFERLIDPRLGAAQVQSKEGATSIITELEEVGISTIAAPGLAVDHGIGLINDRLRYDSTQPIGPMNAPKLYISEACPNVIYAFKNYTNQGGKDEPTKDPIDCFDPETEILTRDGWVPFPDLAKGVPVATMAADGALEFQVPTEYHARMHNGEMVEAHSNSIDFKVTPNHRMLVYPQRPYLKFRLAKDLKRQDVFPLTTSGLRSTGMADYELWPGKVVDCGDWAEFVGWFVAEGSSTGSKGGKIQLPGRGYSVYISQSHTANPEKCRRIADLIDRLGFRANYNGSSFYISSKRLWEILRPLGNSYEKRIPRHIFGFSRYALDQMWEALVLGDGWRSNGVGHYASVSPGLIDDISELFQLTGRAISSIYERDPEKINGAIRGTAPLFMVHEREGERATITTKDKRNILERTQYSGVVYCVTVPNGTLVVRRNKKPLVCGNCVRYLLEAGADFISKDKALAGAGTFSY